MNNNTYPNPWDLRYFQEVASTLNLSRAAERLGIGQPALSLSLKRLEEQLQVSLFLRRPRGLVLTEAGTRLLRECNKLLADWEGVIAETRKSQTELVGRYSLGCHPSVALYSLDPFIRQLYSEHPGIEIQLMHGLSRIVCEQVISGQIDFGIVVNPIAHPDLVITELAKDEVGFWRASKGLNDVLLYNPGLIQSQSLLKKVKKFKFTRTLTSESLEVLCALAKSGAGTAILPNRVVQALAPELKRIEEDIFFQDRITVVWRSDLRSTASARLVMKALKDLKI